MNPWEKGYRPSRLNPDLYSLPQIFAAEGRLPRDHPAWLLSETDEARYIQRLAEAPPLLPDFDEPLALQ